MALRDVIQSIVSETLKSVTPGGSLTIEAVESIGEKVLSKVESVILPKIKEYAESKIPDLDVAVKRFESAEQDALRAIADLKTYTETVKSELAAFAAQQKVVG